MAQRQFTMQELEDLVKAKGQGSPAAEVQSLTRIIPYKPPAGKRDIQRDIYHTCWCAGGEGLTAKQIAEALGIPKSSWLQRHLTRLVEANCLIRIRKAYRGMPIYLYEVAR